MPAVIEANNLVRYFGAIKAVNGVSFSVNQGDVLGFLGPNGAGKSTTMKILTTYLQPSSGSAKVGGFDVVEQSAQVRELLGYLPENAPLYGEMEVQNFLKFIAQARGVEQALQKAALDRVIQLTSLGNVTKQRIETLSRGYKRRVGLAQALLHDPKILILDEPTEGLDPNQKHEVRTLIGQMAKEKCIILSTHILEEVDAVCNRVVIIAEGKIVADSTPEELRSRAIGAKGITVRVDGADGSDLQAQLQHIPGVKKVSSSGKSTYFIMPEEGQDVLRLFLAEAELKRWKVSSISKGVGHLDEVFRTLTR